MLSVLDTIKTFKKSTSHVYRLLNISHVSNILSDSFPCIKNKLHIDIL